MSPLGATTTNFDRHLSKEYTPEHRQPPFCYSIFHSKPTLCNTHAMQSRLKRDVLIETF
jgi:hypothetical protein